MITTHYTLVAIFTFLILGLTISNAEGAAYIKFDGVDGESSDDKHKGWIEILSVNEELYRFVSDATSTRSRGDVILEDIVVVKELDKSSPKLAESVATGKIFAKVNIELTEGNSNTGVTYYAYDLKNVMVTGYSFSGTENDIPIEDVILNFEEITVTYTETDSDGKSKGTTEFTWNQETGVVVSSESSIKLTPEISQKVETAVEVEPTADKEIKVPTWMRGPVGFWSDGLTSDTEFRDSIQFMIKEGFIVVPPIEVTEAEPETAIPGWVKGLAGFWSQGQTSDTEFVDALTYLISKGIIVIGN